MIAGLRITLASILLASAISAASLDSIPPSLPFTIVMQGRTTDSLLQVLTAHTLKDPSVTARIQASFDGIHAMETEARQVLNAAGVPVILYLYYLDFGRELWKLTNRVSGTAAAMEAKILRDKWAARRFIIPRCWRQSASRYSAQPAG